jgi:diguanylate cyclase (GGDEF)-like protein
MEAFEALRQVDMTDRVEMLEAALDLMDEGVAILGEQSIVLFWNKAAAALTGRMPEEVIARRCPEDLYRVDEAHQTRAGASCSVRRPTSPVRVADGLGWKATQDLNRSPTSFAEPESEDDEDDDRLLTGPTLVSITHKLGYSVPSMLRKAILCDSHGEPAGTALLFYAVEEMDKLPHGDTGERADIERSQADMEDRLDAAHHQWVTSRMPFGLLWIMVDQAESLRKTHGRDACESMLRTVEQTLLRQMKPAEIIGRWGNNEYLVLTHERTAELLLEHARRLAGLARTADFRWWGDRVGLTVSVGASQATEGDTLQTLLQRARQAMLASEYAGGNHVTEARKD